VVRILLEAGADLELEDVFEVPEEFSNYYVDHFRWINVGMILLNVGLDNCGILWRCVSEIGSWLSTRGTEENVFHESRQFHLGETEIGEWFWGHLRQNINVQDRRDMTALHLACRYPDELESAAAVIKLLLENNAETDIRDWLGFTPLHYAVQKSQRILVQLLLKQNAALSVVGDNGWTPLDQAIAASKRRNSGEKRS